MDRVFLDANILFSAAYKPDSHLRQLRRRESVVLLASAYAVEESRRNLALTRAALLPDFEWLVSRLTIVPEASAAETLPEEIGLAEKDRPILAAAVAAQATHLLTGDKEHFGHLFGKIVRGVLILPPSAYLLRHSP